MQSHQSSWSCVTGNSKATKLRGHRASSASLDSSVLMVETKRSSRRSTPLCCLHTHSTLPPTHTPLSCLLLLYDCCSDFITVFSSSGAWWCRSTINRRKFDTSVLLSQVDWQIHSVFNWSELYGTIKATVKCDLAVLVIHELITTLNSMSPEANPPT